MSTSGSHQHLASSQEEADTTLIFHAPDAYRRGVAKKKKKKKNDIHSADMDIFILCLGHCESLPDDPLFVTGSKQRKRKIPLAAIREAFGELKTKALIGFPAHSGADITGSVPGKDKTLCWQALGNAENHIHEAFGSIPLADTVMGAVEEYVRQLCQPSTTISRLNELR